jgi:hypothetical protein
MPKITIDMILSDPMLLVGTGLVAFGLLLFLISFWKLVFHSRSKPKFVVPEEGASEDTFTAPQEEPSPAPIQEEAPPAAHSSVHPFPEPQKPVAEEPAGGNGQTTTAPAVADPDKTVVMQTTETETQMQLDIIVSQLKNLNRKVSELEDKLENIPDMTNISQETATLKEAPANIEDYTKKLLKLAEHVIILEKEVARLKGKPPIMPL